MFHWMDVKTKINIYFFKINKMDNGQQKNPDTLTKHYDVRVKLLLFHHIPECQNNRREMGRQ